VQRPSSLGQLDGIPGIGAKKLEAYGEALVRVVSEHVG
jgi:ATP-dependent DNA helicase RecQ